MPLRIQSIASVIACVFALALASCASAQASLTNAVSVEKVVIALPETDVAPGFFSDESRAAMNAKREVYSKAIEDLFSERMEGASVKPVAWNEFVRGSGLDGQAWEFKGQVTPERSVYIANLWLEEIYQMRVDSIELCVVTFDPSALPSELELRHYRLLYAALIEGECSQDALTLENQDLRESLTRVIEDEQYEVRAAKAFENGIEVTVLSEVFQMGKDSDTIGMIADFLDIERPIQSAIVRQVEFDRGFFVLPKGGVIAFQSNDDIGEDNAICVIRGGPWPEVLEGYGIGSWPPREGTKDYRRFCLEEIKAADDLYSERLMEAFDGVELQMSPPLETSP